MAASTSRSVAGALRLARNYGILSGGELLAKVMGLVAFAYLARVLGPQAYGHLEFAIAIAFWFTLLADGGLSTYGAREVASDKRHVSRYAAHIILIKLALSIVAFAILAILVSMLDRPWPVRLLILLYGLTLFATPGMLPWVFQGLDEMQAVALASIIRWSLFAAGVFVLVRRPDQAWMAPLVEGIALIAVAAFYLWRLVRRSGLSRPRLSLALAWSMLRQAWFIGASELVWAGRVYAATLLLGLLISGTQVGWFAAAHRLIVSLHTFVWLYFFNLLPSLSRCSQQPGRPAEHDRLLRLTGASMQMTAWLAVLLGVLGTALAQPVILLIYGEAYLPTVGVLQVLIWFIPLTLLHGHYRYTLIAYGKQNLELLGEACAAVLTVVLALVLVPRFGLIGAAWSMVASEVLMFLLVYQLTKQAVVRIPIWRHLMRPVAAGAMLSVVLYLLRSANVWTMGSAAVIVYGISCYLMQPGLVTDVRALLASGLS